MLTKKERQRFGVLQDLEWKEALSDAERVEWEQFVQRIEAEEAAYLRPATEHLRQETALLEAQNRALKALLERKQRLARRLERIEILSNLEREAINTEMAKILATSLSQSRATL